MSARNRSIHLLWAVPGAALALGATVFAIILIGSATSGHGDPIDAAHQPAIAEGATNRIARREGWYLIRDPNNRGGSLGYPTGRFGGRLVSVPHVANASPVTGVNGIKNYQGGVAWYKTAFTVSAAGVYALRFESVNFRADVWLDGRHLGAPHIGTYLPFEFHFPATAGTHRVVVRTDWRDPAAQSAAGFHRTWFNFGGINGEVSLRAIGASDLVNPTVTTTLAPASDGSVSALVTVTTEVHNNAPQRTIAPTGSLSNGDGSIAVFARDGTPRGVITNVGSPTGVLPMTPPK